MKTAAPPRRARLLALCGLSAALHLLVLDLAARYGAHGPSAHPDAAAPLTVRLAAPAVIAQAGPVAPATRPAPAPPARPPAQPAQPAAASAAGSGAAASTAGVTALPLPGPPADSAAPGIAAAAAGADPGARPVPFNPPAMLPRYQLNPPSAVRLVYQVSGSKGAAAPGQAAYLDWRAEGSAYTLDMDGVLGHRSSSGIVGDEGIVPQRAREQLDGRTLDTAFDAGNHRVVLADGSETLAHTMTLDNATLWVWLASVGNGFAGQLRDGISVNVADNGGVHPISFQVVGEEEVDTGLGRIKAWHLAQYAPPGETRVDAWLAPAEAWLPVQLRVTRPDGGVATQVLQRKEAAGAP